MIVEGKGGGQQWSYQQPEGKVWEPLCSVQEIIEKILVPLNVL